MINRERTIIEMCHDVVDCTKIIGPKLAVSIDGVNIREEGYCLAYEKPSAWYKKGGCPLKPAIVVKKKSFTATGKLSKYKVRK